MVYSPPLFGYRIPKKIQILHCPMKKDKIKWGLYLPKEMYAELYRRQLSEHFSFLVACLLEEFLTRTDVSISREEMPTKAEQREYLKRKLREFFSGTLKGEYPQGKILEKVKEKSLAETIPYVKKRDREEVEEDVRERARRKEEFLKRFEQFL